MGSLIPELPNVLYKAGPRYGVQIKEGSTISVGNLVVADSFQSVIDWNTPTTYNPVVIADVFDHTDATYANLKKFADIDPTASEDQSITGSGKVESLKIIGVAVATNTIDYDLRGNPTDITQYTFDSSFGGQDIRRATVITEGLVWLKYEGTSFPNVGEGVVPSATTDGAVTKLALISGGESFTNGDRVGHVCVGITWGTYDDGTDKYVLVRLTPDLW